MTLLPKITSSTYVLLDSSLNTSFSPNNALSPTDSAVDFFPESPDREPSPTHSADNSFSRSLTPLPKEFAYTELHHLIRFTEKCPIPEIQLQVAKDLALRVTRTLPDDLIANHYPKFYALARKALLKALGDEALA
ncbi:MAG: hypothetical protein KGZ39_01215 [Simkania sp.]|nr:hypothetical protein [Simkania sp.]